MLQKKKWNVLTNREACKIEEVMKILLENRGINNEAEKEIFLHPKLKSVTTDAVGIDQEQLEKTVTRIKKAIAQQEQIIVFGDYDVDGITGTAILWEALYSIGAKVMPYIPDRVEEGYGLSLQGISNVTSHIPNITLIITVDNGIVANDAVSFAEAQGIDVIITDHHAKGEKNPDAYAIVHTTKLCGAGVAWLLSKAMFNTNQNDSLSKEDNHLAFVCLATIADLVPLTGANRTLVKFGLEALHNTERFGLLAICAEAGIEKETIGVYEIGHVIGPRLNAMGRMASAMDSLRLLCTKDDMRAKVLAEKIGRTNRERQLLTKAMGEHAIESINSQATSMKNLLFIYDESYEQGVIGLVASKLVETYYRPAIVLSKGKKYSKASARSIAGFNIIAFIRRSSQLLIHAGGHPMAAGFTVETEKLALLQEVMEALAQQEITEDMLVRSLKIDCELSLSMITQQVYDAIQTIAPFGMGNAEPVFVSRGVIVEQIRAIGVEGKHLKLQVRLTKNYLPIDAIAFGFGELFHEIKVGEVIDVAYVISENVWNGRTSLQLKVKDIKKA